MVFNSLFIMYSLLFFRLRFSSLSSKLYCDIYTFPYFYALLYPPEASGGYFGLASATPPPPRVERFSALTL